LSNGVGSEDFLGDFTENFDLPGKNWLFTAISGQIILFLFKRHHFRTYFLYTIRYNNILRPVHDPMTPSATPLRPPTTLPVQNLGVATPSGLTPMRMGKSKPMRTRAQVILNLPIVSGK